MNKDHRFAVSIVILTEFIITCVSLVIAKFEVQTLRVPLVGVFIDTWVIENVACLCLGVFMFICHSILIWGHGE